MTGTRADFLWTLCGRLGFTTANAVMMLGLYLSDPEGFPLERFGSVLVFIQIQLLLSRLFLVGQDQAVVRFWPERGDRVIEGAFSCVRRVAIWPLGFVILLQFLVPQLGGREHPVVGSDWLFLVVLGAAAQAYLDLSASALMARLRFRVAGLLLSIGPFLRTTAVLLVASDRTEVAYTGGTVVLAAVAIFIAHPNQRYRSIEDETPPPEHGERSLFRYGGWIALADALVVLGLSAGVFALKWRGEEFAVDTSKLSFAMAVTQGHFAIFLAFYQSVLPRASHCRTNTEFQAVLRSARASARRLALGLAALSGLAIAVLIPLVEEFRPDGLGFHWPLCVLTVFMMVLVLEAPFGITAQFLKQPRLQVLGLLVRAVVACVFAYLLSAGGAIPAAVGQTAGAIAGFLALAALTNRALRRHQRQEALACAASQA